MNFEATLRIVVDWYLETKATALRFIISFFPNWGVDVFDIMVFYTLFLFFLRRFYLAFLKRRLNDEPSMEYHQNVDVFKRIYVKIFGAVLSLGPVSRYIDKKSVPHLKNISLLYCCSSIGISIRQPRRKLLRFPTTG